MMYQNVASGEAIKMIEVEEPAEVERKIKQTVVNHTNCGNPEPVR